MLRYLLDDLPDQADAVAEQVMQGAVTAPEYLSECVYVLSGRVYGFSRQEVAGALLLCLDEIDCEHLPSMKRALTIYRDTNFDFPDCILAARHQVEGMPVMTFDKKLQKYIEECNERPS